MIKKKISYEIHAPQARLFNEANCATGKTYQTNCAADQIF